MADFSTNRLVEANLVVRLVCRHQLGKNCDMSTSHVHHRLFIISTSCRHHAIEIIESCGVAEIDYKSHSRQDFPLRS